MQRRAGRQALRGLQRGVRHERHRSLARCDADDDLRSHCSATGGRVRKGIRSIVWLEDARLRLQELACSRLLLLLLLEQVQLILLLDLQRRHGVMIATAQIVHRWGRRGSQLGRSQMMHVRRNIRADACVLVRRRFW